MAAIERQDTIRLSQNWGVTFSDYSIDGDSVDFQDLMVKISEHRAVAVESEVTPLSGRIKARNKTLEDLGKALAELTAQQATYDSNATGSTQSGYPLSDEVRAILGRTVHGVSYGDRYLWKSKTEEIMQLVKSKIDALNNEAQTDMSRLQSLVDRRDESYSTATTLMSAISDTRSNLIRNL